MSYDEPKEGDLLLVTNNYFFRNQSEINIKNTFALFMYKKDPPFPYVAFSQKMLTEILLNGNEFKIIK